MICADLLEINSLKGLTLIAGERGLDRTIRWVYFADTLESVEDFSHPSNWVHGGEIAVITSKRMLSNKDNLLGFIKDANEKDIAGVIVNVGYIDEEVITLANSLKIPLFELPWSIKSVDLSQILCKLLVEEEKQDHMLDLILGNILYSNEDKEEDLIYQSLYYGYDLRKKNRIAVLDIDNFANFIKKNKLNDEGKINDVKRRLRGLTKTAFKKHGIKKIMTLIQSDSIMILFPTNILTDEEIIETFEDVRSSFKSLFNGVTFSVGIGNCYDGIVHLKKSFKEAIKTIEISQAVENEGHIWFYKSMGFYSLLFYVEDKLALETYYKAVLGDLVDYDEEKSSELTKTLEIYLEENLSMANTSDRLFIHRNTLRYRLDRIQKIINANLSDLKIVSKISLAFAVKKYLDAMY